MNGQTARNINQHTGAVIGSSRFKNGTISKVAVSVGAVSLFHVYMLVLRIGRTGRVFSAYPGGKASSVP